jgi:Icc-related predicted phosphoesterase
MRVLVVSDLHGDLKAAGNAREFVQPDMILSCGDWGDADQVTQGAVAALLATVPVYTTFGNHDAMEILAQLRNRDGSAVLLPQGTVQIAAGLRLAAIGGIWAKSHAKPHYVTDADVAEAATRIARSGPVDILLTHGCPIGVADLTPSGRHGGQRCFLDAQKLIAPRLHLCGHLHVAQERVLKDGRKVINVGASSEGSIVVVEFDEARDSLEARLEQLPPP